MPDPFDIIDAAAPSLTPTPSLGTGAVPAPAADPFEFIDSGGAPADKLTISTRLGIVQDQARAARILRLQARTQLPADLLDRNLDEIEQEAKRADFNPAAFRAASPRVAAWLAEQPEHMAIAKDDLPLLAGVEHLVRSSSEYAWDKDGAILGPVIRQGDGAQREYYRSTTDLLRAIKERRQLAVVDDVIQRQQDAETRDRFGAVGGRFVAGAAGALSATQRALGTADTRRQAGDLAASAERNLPGFWGDVASGVGGVTADVPLMLAGGALAPVATLKRLAGLGAFAKAALGTGLAVQPLALREGINVGKDEGWADGLTAWAIETTIPAAFGSTGTEKVLMGLAKRGVPQAAARGFAGAAGRLLLDVGLEATEEAVTELAHAIHEVSAGIDPGALDPDRIWHRLGVAGAVGGLTSGGFNLPGFLAAATAKRAAGGPSVDREVQRLVQAASGQELLSGIMSAAAQSSSAGASPEGARTLFQSLADERIPQVWIDREAWDKHFTSLGQDPRARASELLGDTRAYDEAARTGAPLRMETGRLAVDLSKDKATAEWVTREARLDPAMMNAREAEEHVKAMESVPDDPEAKVSRTAQEAAQLVLDQVEEQLTAAGYDAASARRTASQLSAVFRTMAARWNAGRSADDQLRTDAHKLFSEWNVGINRPVPDVLSSPEKPNAALSLAMMRSRIADAKLEAIDTERRAAQDAADQQLAQEAAGEAGDQTIAAAADVLKRSGTAMTMGDAMRALGIEYGFRPDPTAGTMTGEQAKRGLLLAAALRARGKTLADLLRDVGLAKPDPVATTARADTAADDPALERLAADALRLRDIVAALRGARMTDEEELLLMEQAGALAADVGPSLDQLPLDEASVNEVRDAVAFAQDGLTFNQRGVQAVGNPVPSSVLALTNVEAAFAFAGTKTFPTNRAFKVEIQRRALAAAADAGVDITEISVGTEDYLVQAAVADAVTALRTNPNAVGWYNEKVTKALRLVSLIHPEIATDRQAKFAFVWAMAVTSNGLKVDKNFELAEKAYAAYKATGQMPTNIGEGPARAAIDEGLAIYNEMLAKHGFEAAERFMTTKATVKEIQAFSGLPVSGENLTTVVYGSAVLGPKIGNGFFSNLYGNFEQLTMDRWLMRTWGRWTGTLIEENPAQVAAKRKQIRGLAKLLTKQDAAAFEGLIKIKLRDDPDLVAEAIKKASGKKENRNAMAKLGVAEAGRLSEVLGEPVKGARRISVGDEIRKAGNALAKYNDGQKEAPSGPPERAAIRRVFARALEQLQAENPQLTMADLQALLWYPEKRLYDAAKATDEADEGYADDEAPDYANAAAKLARAAGISDQAIAQATKEVDDALARDRTAAAGRGPGGSPSGDRDAGRAAAGAAGAADRGLTLYQGEATPAFRKWFGKSKAVDENGDPLRVFHGTTNVFNAFEKAKANPESDLGAGFYFTNNPDDVGANYAGEGPDLTNKIERRAEQIQNDEDIDYEEAKEKARAEMSQHGGAVLPVFLKMENPVIIGGAGQTYFDMTYNEDTGEESGPLVKVIEALRSMAGDFQDLDVDQVVADITEDGPELYAEDLIDKMKKSEGMVYATDDIGNMMASEIVRRTFEKAGFDGFIDRSVNKKFGSEKRVGKPMEGMDEDTVHYIVFKPTQIKSATGNRGTFDPANPSILFQRKKRRRGSITFGRREGQRQTDIRLFEGADLSTVLHENGHLYLDLLIDLAGREGCPQEIKDDLAAALKWLGVEKPEDIGVDQHEQWARGFEAYLMEGKAPSKELRGPFARFAAWLAAIYRDVRALAVDLTPEVRGVFDRLLATQEEIDEASAKIGDDPLFTDAASAGMTEAEFAAYQKARDEARRTAEEQIRAQAMEEITRERTAAWKDLTKEVRQEVELEVNRAREYVAAAILKRGTLPGGVPLPPSMVAIKLDSAEVGARLDRKYPTKQARNAARVRLIGMHARTGGIGLDEAARILGFDSGDALLNAMLGLRDRRELIDAETKERMRARFGDILTDGTIAEKAMQALHNERRADVHLAEVKALATKIGKKVAPIEVLREAARRRISGMSLRDLQPQVFIRAEMKARRQLEQALAKQDFNAAWIAKQQELLNHELYRAAVEAKVAAEKAVEKLKSYTERKARERIGKAGGWEWTVTRPDGRTETYKTEDEARAAAAGAPFEQTSGYLIQIDALLERYELRKVGVKQLDRRANLAAWIEQQEKLGAPVNIPPEIAAGARVVNYRQVPVRELFGLRDAIANIAHLANLKNKLSKAQREAELDQKAALLARTLERTHPKQVTKKIGEKAGALPRLAALHRKAANMAREMDGDEDAGDWWDTLIRPINEAGDAEASGLREADQKQAAIWRTWGEKTKNDGWPAGERREFDGFEGGLTRLNAIMIALNWGNAGNRERLLEGGGGKKAYGKDGNLSNVPLTEAQVLKVLDALDAADWDLVEAVWEHIDSYWSEIAALEQRTTGVAPTKVEPSPFPTRHGTIRGGYFPIIYDGDETGRIDGEATDLAKQIMAQAHGRTQTSRGHTKERTTGQGRALDLDPGVIGKHLTRVIHDLTHREAVADALRIILHPTVRAAIDTRMGPAVTKALRQWVADIAAGPPTTTGARMVGLLRRGFSMATMGYRTMTAAVQLTGFANAAARVGPARMAAAIGSLFASRGDGSAWAFVTELSTMMRERVRTQSRELAETLGSLQGKGASSLDKAERFQASVGKYAYWMMQQVQGVVDRATWLAAFDKAQGEGHTEQDSIAIADQAVLDTQGGGQVKDTSGVQRDAYLQVFTGAYTYGAMLFNQLYDQAARVRRNPKDFGTWASAAGNMMLMTALPATLTIILRGLARDWWDDEDDKDPFAKRVAAEWGSTIMGTMVGVRELSGTPSGFSYGGPAVTRPLGELGNLMAQIGQGEIDKGLARAVANAIGYGLSLPSGQAWATGEGIYQWLEEPSADLRPIIFGPGR